jgi:hypothetical protein
MRKTVRGAALFAAAGALALGATACGDDDESSGTVDPPVLSMSVTESGKTATLKAPAEAKSGVTKIALKNDGKNTHEAQIVRVTGDQTAEDVVQAVSGEEGKGTPEWIVDGGGVGTVQAGRTGEVIQDLKPGRYVAFDMEGSEEGAKPATAEFTITDEKGTEAGIPETDAKITAKDFSFETSGLKAGDNLLTFENTGKELHHAIVLPVKPGASFAEVKEEFSKEDGNPAVDFENGVATAVIDGGVKQIVNIPMEAGKYALVCFINNRAGGPPHVALGMVTEVDVK